MEIRVAQRIASLPPYLFADIDRRVSAARGRGVDVISFGIGDPDLPAPPAVVEAVARAVRDPATHDYPNYNGMPRFRAACCRYLAERCGAELDPERECLALIGSKEGLAHLPLALLDPGDVALVPDPGYPVYANSIRFAGGQAVAVPLSAERGFVPDLEAIPADLARRAKLIVVNYPNNPTGATADLAWYERLLAWARRYEVIVVADAAYREVALEGPPAPSLLSLPGARAVALEFHSLSKTFNMTGFRIGFVAGNAALVAALGKVKTNVDSGPFDVVQEAGIAALEQGWAHCAATCAAYRRRRDLLVPGLRGLGLTVTPPRASFFVWAGLPAGVRSGAWAADLIERAGVVATPGAGFGPGGEGFVRFSLTVPEERIAAALQRLR